VDQVNNAQLGIMETYKKLDRYTLRKVEEDIPREKIISPEDAAAYIRKFYGEDLEIYESMFLLLLNRSNTTIGYAKISQGGVVGTVVDIKIILKYVVESLATGAILAHNHPSGNLMISDQDVRISNDVKQAMKILDSQLIDSIIITKEGYTSLSVEGRLS
jgi:DNA repair protein RadC